VGRPVPTPRALWLVAAGLVPAVFAVVAPGLAWVALSLDLAVLLLVVIDFLRAPRLDALEISRQVEPVLSSGLVARVTLHLHSRGPLRGELRDLVPPGPLVEGARQRFVVDGEQLLEWRLTPTTRGDLLLGGVWVRLEGPLGLCLRQGYVPLTQLVKVFPDLTALTKDALALARANADDARRVVRQRSDGREFESLREYRAGDDRRTIDWKATARRGKAVVRLHQPERNQQVLLLLDCGRHMAGTVGARRKLDHSVDAALRLARVSLDQGDQVGVLAFGTTVKAHLPARRGSEQLRAIAHALYRVEATLEESDVGAALDLAFARQPRRSLVIILTDLLDAESSAALVKRTLRLVPRHLPMVASLLDDDVHALAMAVPATGAAAYERLVAARLEAETTGTVARLRDAGARVVRSSPGQFGAAAVSAYLDVKNRGLL
jgi:uncharacterized protein (DUF58 family)